MACFYLYLRLSSSFIICGVFLFYSLLRSTTCIRPYITAAATSAAAVTALYLLLSQYYYYSFFFFLVPGGEGKQLKEAFLFFLFFLLSNFGVGDLKGGACTLMCAARVWK